MKKIFPMIIAFLMLISISVSAQPSARDIIERIHQKYEKIENVIAEFEQVFHWDLTDETQITSGKVWLGKTEKYRIETDDQIVVTDGVSVWTYSKVSNQVVIDRVGQSKESPLLRDLLLKYSQEYQPLKIGTETINDNNCYILQLTAKTDDAYITAVTVWVDQKNYTVHRIKQVDINGNSNTYTLKNIVFEAKIAENTFKYTRPDGVEVIDLRP